MSSLLICYRAKPGLRDRQLSNQKLTPCTINIVVCPRLSRLSCGIDKWTRGKLRCYSSRRLGVAQARCQRASSMAHQRVGTWLLAVEQDSGTGVGIAGAVLQEPGVRPLRRGRNVFIEPP